MNRLGLGVFLVLASVGGAQDADLAKQLRDLDDKELSAAALAQQPLGTVVSEDVRARIQAANRRETAAWRKVTTRDEWQQFSRVRIAALRDSLGLPSMDQRPSEYHVGKTIEGEGYRLECLAFKSWRGQWVPALLYLPAKKPTSMPGMLICHSHHNPKTEGELQDMGVLWSRLRCAVLIMDQLGHGERREHPFVDAKSFDGMFQAGRQDYYFRYNLSLQLYAAGSSLVGWMVADLSRGVDLLRDRGVDMGKVVLLGAVAGGGDPAAVTAALDERIRCVVPFNFGGPQPETRLPVPNDVEDRFNYAGGGSWESTRNLRLSAKSGFHPWVIVGSVAPRHLIHAHEFAWDRDNDPVWRRYNKIFEFYNRGDALTAVHGAGSVRGTGPGNTHCNNIGAVHRKDIYPALKKWFAIPVPEGEMRDRRAAAELRCLTDDLKKKLAPEPSYVIARREMHARLDLLGKQMRTVGDAAATRDFLRKEWTPLLGNIEPPRGKIEADSQSGKIGEVQRETLLIKAEGGIALPAVLLIPPRKEGVKLPLVLAVSQDGKAAMLRKWADAVAELLEKGVAVCLLDVRGTGETRPDNGRGRTSSATALSATELMLGDTMVGARLRDLRTALSYLRERTDIDPKKVALWGDSLAAVNAVGAKVEVPHNVTQPTQAEPLGALLALFGTLFDERIKGAYSRGGLVNYRSLLEGPFLHVPHDAIVPGGIRAGDLDMVATALGQRLRQTALVDSVNRATGKDVEERPVRWLLERLKE